MNIKGKYIIECFFNAVIYIPATLYMTFLVLVIGFVFGTLVALIRTYRIKFISLLLDIYVAVFKALPVNLIIVVASLIFTTQFDSFAQALHLNIRVRDVNMLYLGVFALSFTCITQFSENIRGALMSISKGQFEAGYTVGLTGFQTFHRIIFPQLILVLIPTLTGLVIGMIKASSLVILIGVVDILNGSLKYANAAYCFFEAYLAAAIVYWILSLVIQFIGNCIEKRLGRYRRELA